MVEAARRAQLQAALTTQIPTSNVDPDTGVITPGTPLTAVPPDSVLDALASIVPFVQVNADVLPGIAVNIPATSVPPAPSVGVTVASGKIA